MGRKRKESNIASVMYSYVGTDDQFDDFLKMMIHDYDRLGAVIYGDYYAG